jgi:3-oxoacyl-[acyl-carrier-protein] synthase II
MSDLELNIIGWSAMSPFGLGKDDFTAGLREARSTVTKLEGDAQQLPSDRACLVPDFDLRAALGKKGTRMMNRVTGLAVTTVGNLLRDIDNGPMTPEETGLVLGTGVGSAQSTIDFTRGSLTGEQPFHVEPGLIPYAVMNGAAGQCAIWHRLKGPNATLAAGRPGGLLALAYSRRLLLAGRASTVLCGAAEEFSEARSWIAHHSSEDPTSDLLLGEGCAMFALSAGSAGSEPPIASLVAVRTMFCGDGSWRAVLARCIAQVLAANGVAAADIWAVCPSDAGGAPGAGERAAVGGLFDQQVIRPPISEFIGETHAASASFQLAALLTIAEADPAAAGRMALVTSVDDSGTVAVALLRLAA